MPVLVLERFGLESFSSNNGIVSLAPAIFGSFPLPLTAIVRLTRVLREHLQLDIWQDLRLARPPTTSLPSRPPLSLRDNSSRPPLYRRISVLPSSFQDDHLHVHPRCRTGHSLCCQDDKTREGSKEGSPDRPRVVHCAGIYIAFIASYTERVRTNECL